MPDKNIVCKDCGATFVFTESEQNFFKEKGFENEPLRCPDCRAARKQARHKDRQLYPAVCSECGIDIMLPFQASDNRPVYCRDCFRNVKGY